MLRLRPSAPGSSSTLPCCQGKKKIEMLCSAYLQNHKCDKVSGWQSHGSYLEESKYLVETDVPQIPKHSRTSEFEVELLSSGWNFK